MMYNPLYENINPDLSPIISDDFGTYCRYCLHAIEGQHIVIDQHTSDCPWLKALIEQKHPNKILLTE